MRLGDLGEFELIEQMSAVFGPGDAVAGSSATAFVRPAVGIGDDAAVWRTGPDILTIATTDAMVEGVHFTADTAGWYDLGWRAMASNLSDIAGMGGQPRYALVALAARADTQVGDVLDMCRGMAAVAGEVGALVVGGDTVSSPITMISITVIGEANTGFPQGGDTPPLLSRYTARPGYAIAVTGALGSSAGGLELLLGANGSVPDRYTRLVQAHRRPVPRVQAGLTLVRSGVRCGMDLSDGLAGDLARICKASGVSAVVEEALLPLDPLLREAAGGRAVDLALSGGEDYELLVLAPEWVLDGARDDLLSTGTPLTVVGRAVDPDEGSPAVMVQGEDGEIRPPKRSGWDHFSGRHDATG